jgi:hypothetical protein
MHAVYRYLIGATAANVVADLTKLLTGNHDIANYSAACDKTNTQIINNVIPPGWSIHDPSAGASSQVIKAPLADNPAAFKYVELYGTTTEIAAYACESWNEIAHAPVNRAPAQGQTTFAQRYSATVAGLFHVVATEKYLCLFGEYGTTLGDSSSGALLVAEYSRIQPWHTVASNYPAVAAISTGQTIGGSGKQAWIPRAKKRNGLDAVVTGIGLATIAAQTGNFSTAANFPTGADAKLLDADNNRVCPLFPLYLIDTAQFSAPLGDLSSVADVWIAPHDILAHLEIVPRDTAKYLAIQAGAAGQRIALRLE